MVFINRKKLLLIIIISKLISVPLASDEHLTNVLTKENYSTSKPITFYTMKLDEGVFYGSRPTNEYHPFTKNNDFVKTFPKYKQVKL